MKWLNTDDAVPAREGAPKNVTILRPLTKGWLLAIVAALLDMVPTQTARAIASILITSSYPSFRMTSI